MTRKTTLLTAVSSLAVAGLLLTGCSDDGPGSDLPPDGANGDGGGSDSGAELDMSYDVLKDAKGCDVLDELNPVRDYMGVTELKSDLINAGVGEGLDGEAALCSGLFSLATYTFSEGSFETSTTGDASILAAVVPATTEEEASANFQERLDSWEENPSGVNFTEEQEGELGGEWDESYYFGANGGSNRYYINAYGRYGTWVVYISLDFLHDPGLRDDAEQVYPFTEEEILDWVANEYMPQTQADILEQIESEQ